MSSSHAWNLHKNARHRRPVGWCRALARLAGIAHFLHIYILPINSNCIRLLQIEYFRRVEALTLECVLVCDAFIRFFGRAGHFLHREQVKRYAKCIYSANGIAAAIPCQYRAECMYLCVDSGLRALMRMACMLYVVWYTSRNRNGAHLSDVVWTNNETSIRLHFNSRMTLFVDGKNACHYHWPLMETGHLHAGPSWSLLLPP